MLSILKLEAVYAPMPQRSQVRILQSSTRYKIEKGIKMSLHPTPQYWQPVTEEEIEKEFNFIKLRTSLERLTREQLIEQFIELVLLNGSKK